MRNNGLILKIGKIKINKLSSKFFDIIKMYIFLTMYLILVKL